MELALSNTIRKPTWMCFGIRPSDPIEINVALNAAWIITLNIMARRTSFDVLPCPVAVASSSGANATQHPRE